MELAGGSDFMAPGKKIVFKYIRLQHMPYKIKLQVPLFNYLVSHYLNNNLSIFIG